MNPFTKQAVEIEVQEPAPGAVPPVQGLGYAARRAATSGVPAARSSKKGRSRG